MIEMRSNVAFAATSALVSMIWITFGGDLIEKRSRA